MRLPQFVDRARSFSRSLPQARPRSAPIKSLGCCQVSHIVTACHSSAANAFTPTESHMDLRRMVREFAV